MLALRSKGIDKEEFKRLFGYNWFKKNETKIGEYIKNNYLTDDKYYLKCTSKGYAVCDEIIKNLI
jgi:coproporphyrinogen III oxidase-like Fe-S oxidoreductase